MPGETYNVGGGNEVPNIDLTQRILALVGKPESLIQPVTDRPGHDRRYSLDCAQAARAWAGRRRCPSRRACGATVEWYRDARGLVAAASRRRTRPSASTTRRTTRP